MLPCDKIFLEAFLEAGGSKLLAWWIMVCNTGLAGKKWTDEKRLKKESFHRLANLVDMAMSSLTRLQREKGRGRLMFTNLDLNCLYSVTHTAWQDLSVSYSVSPTGSWNSEASMYPAASTLFILKLDVVIDPGTY